MDRLSTSSIYIYVVNQLLLIRYICMSALFNVFNENFLTNYTYITYGMCVKFVYKDLIL